ncbi:MAG: hypothetical protein R3C52_03120 [Hyphomonadaceae bacterium]
MLRTCMIVVSAATLALACTPKPDTSADASAPPAETGSTAPDIAAAAAAGDPDPRLPTVDPATITADSSVADVMHAFIIPGSESLFAAESEAPVDEAGWTRLQKAAQDVITGCEMLKEPARSMGPEWDKTCDTVIAATKMSAEALAQNNADDLVFTDGDMMAGCTSCHQQFRDMVVPEGHLAEEPSPN